MTRSASGPLAVGLDVGTQGARAICVDARGRVLARARRPFAGPDIVNAAEQVPETWWEAATVALREMVAGLGPDRSRIAAIATSATSGTLCALDAAGRPIRPALMYGDRRSVGEAARLNDLATRLEGRPIRRFDASFSLPKALWLRSTEPAAFASVRRLTSQGDYLLGRLGGDFAVSDHTQTLKLGFDVAGERWPAFLETELGFDPASFPRVVEAGTDVGVIRPEAADVTGLPGGTRVVVGVTDGVAGQLACDPAPGRWTTVLGTTLVWKGMSERPVEDPEGRIYNHRGPAGTWLPGAAGNCGGRIVNAWFGGVDWAAWDDRLPDGPTGLLVYPLVGPGERYPVRDPAARGFVIGAIDPDDRGERMYAACLEGVAFVERWGYDVARGLGAAVDGPIATTGGATRSGPWLRLRANVLGRPLRIPAEPEPAFGAAIIAASAFGDGGVPAAAHRMVTWAARVDPSAERSAAYEEPYRRFRDACRERGYR